MFLLLIKNDKTHSTLHKLQFKTGCRVTGRRCLNVDLIIIDSFRFPFEGSKTYCSAFIILADSLTINRAKAGFLKSCHQSHVSIGLSVDLSGKCIVAKRLIGSGCRLGW